MQWFKQRAIFSSPPNDWEPLSIYCKCVYVRRAPFLQRAPAGKRKSLFAPHMCLLFIDLYACVYMCTCAYVHRCLSVYVLMCICAYVHMRLSVYVLICICAYVYMCKCVHVHMCTCAHICIGIIYIPKCLCAIYLHVCVCTCAYV